jgi:hypothetical protein
MQTDDADGPEPLLTPPPRSKTILPSSRKTSSFSTTNNARQLSSSVARTPVSRRKQNLTNRRPIQRLVDIFGKKKNRRKQK